MFFHILAINPHKALEVYLKDKFRQALNWDSSLFEYPKLEQETVTVNTLSDKIKIGLYGRSVLKSLKHIKMALFAFIFLTHVYSFRETIVTTIFESYL